MIAARLVTHQGISYVVNNGARRPATPYECDLFALVNGALGALGRLELDWGYVVIEGDGDWFDNPAKCRDVAAALEGRARGLEGKDDG